MSRRKRRYRHVCTISGSAAAALARPRTMPVTPPFCHRAGRRQADAGRTHLVNAWARAAVLNVSALAVIPSGPPGHPQVESVTAEGSGVSGRWARLRGERSLDCARDDGNCACRLRCVCPASRWAIISTRLATALKRGWRKPLELCWANEPYPGGICESSGHCRTRERVVYRRARGRCICRWVSPGSIRRMGYSACRRICCGCC